MLIFKEFAKESFTNELYMIIKLAALTQLFAITSISPIMINLSKVLIYIKGTPPIPLEVILFWRNALDDFALMSLVLKFHKKFEK